MKHFIFIKITADLRLRNASIFSSSSFHSLYLLIEKEDRTKENRKKDTRFNKQIKRERAYYTAMYKTK